MKLSANAREYVTETVKAAFGDELKAAEDALDRFDAMRSARYSKFETGLRVLERGWVGEVADLARDLGLTWVPGSGPDCGMSVVLNPTGSRYGEASDRMFVETSEYAGGRRGELVGGVKAVRDRIGRAVRAALFEIEVHGRKSTLDQIVADVIARVRAESADGGKKEVK